MGSSQVVLHGTGDYTSTNTNVTQENLFTHLNLTDGSVVLYMPFDVIQDSANKTYDYSNYSNDGTCKANFVYNTTEPLRGEGGYYTLDGSAGTYIDAGNDSSLNLTSSFTISIWVKQKALVSFASVISKGAVNYYMTLHSTGKPYLAVKVAGAEKVTYGGTMTVLPNGEWHMLTGTFNGTHISYYYDGKKEGLTTAIVGGKVDSTTLSVDIGKRLTTEFNGDVDEVIILNKALNSYEIGQLYNATYPIFYPVGEMNFTGNNFGTNNTVNITIPNCQQYNGSLINFKVNDGSYSQLNSSCMFDNYNMTGDLTSASVVLQLNSTNNYFYSPVINGNITLDNWYISTALPWINYNPINGTKSCFAFNSNKGGKFAYNYLPIVATNCTR